MPPPDLFLSPSEVQAPPRPVYPTGLFAYLSTLTMHRRLAWDCGTGSGEAAAPLAGFYQQVVGTDISRTRLSQGLPLRGVQYRCEMAESSSLQPGSVDLITVAHALHYFDQSRFWNEVRRVSRSGGVLAFWSYGLPKIDSAAQAAAERVCERLWPHWSPQETTALQGYSGVHVPFRKVEAPLFEMSAKWTVEDFLAHVRGWAAYKSSQRTSQDDGLADLAEELRKLHSQKSFDVRWPLSLRVFRL